VKVCVYGFFTHCPACNTEILVFERIDTNACYDFSISHSARQHVSKLMSDHNFRNLGKIAEEFFYIRVKNYLGLDLEKMS
jgi:hypothetical protein